MARAARGLPSRQASNIKIVLLVIASAFAVGVLIYSQHLTDQLLQREREIVGLYARSLEFINSSGEGDLSFAFDVIRAIDFPIILTDSGNVPIYWKNVDVDTASLDAAAERIWFRNTITTMDVQNRPIRITVEDTLVLNYIHFGESALVAQLRWLPLLELALAAIFILVAYLGFSTIKRSEQSNIWVGMAKETAHQLGTPLSSLMGWLERLRDASADRPEVVETIGEMDHDITRLNKVAARFSKIGSKPDLREEDLAEVIRSVIAYFDKRLPRTGRRVGITLESTGPFPARINRELFEWVIENLIKNALDAMGGPTGSITFTIAASGRRVTVDVADTGKGIDPKLHREIFQPGFSTKKRGWGLGLTLSKRIIEEYHQGKLFVKQSAPGQGTTFRIRLER
jgi:signal transduction histidine kinase